MKKYRYCFLLLLGTVALLLAAGFFYSRNLEGRMEGQPAGTDAGEEMKDGGKSLPPHISPEETSRVEEDQIVLNQRLVEPVPGNPMQFLLVSEDGFLLVFGSSRSEICLYTHIPITDFPEKEREKLRDGIWFSAMEEIYSYLESYTS
ncbi:MAG: hypothetical protein Q4F29_06090 [Lachnospiraceae bacterium]|nr:hypothetical protein [Lachnospiraceae bacterium]